MKFLNAFLLTAVGYASAAMTFVHPGALNSREEIDTIKARIASGAEPWSTELAKMKRYGFGTFTPHGGATTVLSTNNTEANRIRDDALASYTQALIWAYTDSSIYADRAIAILNSWSSLQGFSAGTDQDKLQAGWIGSVFAPAAEILRSYSGWDSTAQAAFQAMFRRAFYPKLETASNWNGNVDLTQIDAIMGIAVFNEDSAFFELGLQRWRARLPSYIYLTSDGALPIGIAGDNGNVRNFWSKPIAFVDGLDQESCRDNGHHSQFALGSAIHAAEIAHHQGVNLYAEGTERLVAAMELTAGQLGSGNWATCNDTVPTGDRYDTWEIGYNHFHNRLGMDLPNTASLIMESIRPNAVRTSWNLAYETITHGNAVDYTASILTTSMHLAKRNGRGVVYDLRGRKVGITAQQGQQPMGVFVVKPE